MISWTRSALRHAAAVMFLNMAFASAASAQDVMQLDLMFRDSLLRPTASVSQADDGGRRQAIGLAPESARGTWRRRKLRHHQKT